MAARARGAIKKKLAATTARGGARLARPNDRLHVQLAKIGGNGALALLKRRLGVGSSEKLRVTGRNVGHFTVEAPSGERAAIVKVQGPHRRDGVTLLLGCRQIRQTVVRHGHRGPNPHKSVAGAGIVAKQGNSRRMRKGRREEKECEGDKHHRSTTKDTCVDEKRQKKSVFFALFFFGCVRGEVGKDLAKGEKKVWPEIFSNSD